MGNLKYIMWQDGRVLSHLENLHHLLAYKYFVAGLSLDVFVSVLSPFSLSFGLLSFAEAI